VGGGWVVTLSLSLSLSLSFSVCLFLDRIGVDLKVVNAQLLACEYFRGRTR